MPPRVPLLWPSAIVLHRLDIEATRAVDPPGSETSGYHPYLRAPIPYEDASTGDKESSLRYRAPIRIPCQVEVRTFEEVRQQFGGDAPIVNMIFVLHNRDLSRLGLIRKETGCTDGDGRVRISTNDKITAIERNRHPGVVIKAFKQPLYVVQVQPASWGFGDGFDLELMFVNNRPALRTASGGTT